MTSTGGTASQGVVTPQEFLRRIDKIRQHRDRKGSRPAPHKPLLLLLALGRLSQGKPRLANYAEEVEQPLRRLLEQFGRPGQKARPAYPFWRLCNDELWDIPDANSVEITDSDDVHVKDLRKRGIAGGFPEPLQQLLRADPALVETTAALLLAANFTDSLHHAVRHAVGLPVELVLDQPLLLASVPTPSRDPRFRPEVLAAYGESCAICDFAARVGGDLIGVDAAHIQWHSHQGPDTVPNGLALCKLHHHALDRGAIGLQSAGTQFKMVVSRQVQATGEAARQIHDAHGRLVRKPSNPALLPSPKFVEWHQENVFRA